MLTKIAMTILAASLAATLVIPVTAMAEGECQQDRQKFCNTETKATVGACLDEHMAELSEVCKAMRQLSHLRRLRLPKQAPSLRTRKVAATPQALRPSPALRPSSLKPTLPPQSRSQGLKLRRQAPQKRQCRSRSSILINIDKSLQQMTVFVDGIEKYSWPVSTGKYGYSTPSGTCPLTSMNEVWYSRQWDNAPMPHSIFFLKDGHAIHGSHEVKNLGKPVSHGCVRISPDNAAILYDLVKSTGMENTKVVLAGVTPGDQSNVPDEPAYSYNYGAAPWGPGPGFYFNSLLRDEVFLAGGSGGLMAVRRAIIGLRVVTEDIRTSAKT